MKTDPETEAALDEALQKLPRYPAPPSLRARLAERVAAESRSAPRRVGWNRARRWLFAGPIGALAAAALILLYVRVERVGPGPGNDPMVTEAVNDHLRVLFAERPIEIESGGIHQVKPWFSGRLDFAPRVPFAGDGDFLLEGGSVAYFVDRKAADFVFKRRLHTISVFVFRADGLPWENTATPTDHAHPKVTSLRGFNVVMFRDGDLGYALVSDVDVTELETLAKRVVGL